MKTLIAFVSTLALSATLAVPALAKTVDNPEYGMWKGFGPGSTATYETTTVTAGNTMKATETITLVSIDADKAVISTERVMVVAGREIKQPAMKRTIQAKVDVPDQGAVEQKGPEAKTEKGNETVTVAGTALACEWTKVQVKTAAGDTTTHMWTCKKVPGHQVKLKSSTAGTYNVETTRVLTAFTVK